MCIRDRVYTYQSRACHGWMHFHYMSTVTPHVHYFASFWTFCTSSLYIVMQQFASFFTDVSCLAVGLQYRTFCEYFCSAPYKISGHWNVTSQTVAQTATSWFLRRRIETASVYVYICVCVFVLCCCSLRSTNGIRPVKTRCWGDGMVVCLERVTSRLVLPFWYWLTWVVPGKWPLNGCVHFLVYIYTLTCKKANMLCRKMYLKCLYKFDIVVYFCKMTCQLPWVIQNHHISCILRRHS